MVADNKPKSASSTEGCPVMHAHPDGLNPTNMMPSSPNQEPYPGQKEPLSKDRVNSSIPRGNSSENWIYPSPQMFYNALRRKGKDDDVDPKEIENVVMIHNNMNERAWVAVMEWESRYRTQCANPRLAKFRGRPFDLSPKARIKTWFGWPVPFDRHDWIVDRCGRDVRYVIDYYYDEKQSAKDQLPGLKDESSIQSITMDVRPALDSFSSVIDRLVMFPRRFWQALHTRRPTDSKSPFDYAKEQEAKTDPSVPTLGLNPKEISHAALIERIYSECAPQFAKTRDATTEEQQVKATNALNYCIGRVACPSDAREFMRLLEAQSPDSEVNAAYDRMLTCVSDFGRLVAESKSRK